MRSVSVGHSRARLEYGLVASYLQLIEDRFGLQLTEHQSRNLPDVVTNLADLSGLDGPHELYDALAAGNANPILDELAARLTIGETHFFRVEPQIDALRQTVLPELIRQRSSEKRLRIWSAGCSTGEEAYTLAMLLRDWVPAGEGWDTRILATDINDDALGVARSAVYGEWSFRGTSDHLRDRYFSPEGKTWRLQDSIRNMVQYAHVNLGADFFPLLVTNLAPFDLIVCRNVTIYFSGEATQRLYERFEHTIAPTGWLLLGPSDPTPNRPTGFEPLPLLNAVIWRRTIRQDGARTSSLAPGLDRTATSSVTRRNPKSTHPAQPGRSTARPAIAPEPRKTTEVVTRGAPLEAAKLTVPKTAPDALHHLRLGLLHLDDAAAGPAVENLRRASFLEPADPFIQYALGRAYSLDGAAARAQAAFTHAQRLLVGLTDDTVLTGADGIVAGELRHVIAAELSSAGHVASKRNAESSTR